MKLFEVKNFTKKFGSRIVHENVSFDLFKGECLGLIGGSGTGKSVLLRSLIGLEKPNAGDLIFEGKILTGLKEKEWIPIRKKVAYAFQGGALFDSMTVYDNLAYPLREHTELSELEIKNRIIDLLEDFGLSNSENLYPANLSGGMQKRVGLARAIILQPEVILYDEPTAGLDPFNTKIIEEMIIKFKSRGVTSILVTHDMPVAYQVCDRIILLKDGHIKQSGNVNDLKNQKDSWLEKFAAGEI